MSINNKTEIPAHDGQQIARSDTDTGADGVPVVQQRGLESGLDAERFNAAAMLAADWYWEMDSELRYTFQSAEFEAITGIPVTEVIGKTREEAFAGRIDDIRILGAQVRANFCDPAIDEQNIRIVEAISGAGQNRRTGKECRSGWQWFVAAVVRRRAIIGAVVFAIPAAGRSQ